MSDDIKQDIFTRVTNKIVSLLETGVRPWQPSWNNTGDIATNFVMPRRHSNEQYKGVNVLMLWAVAQEKGFKNPYFMTFNQAQDYKANVRKGEKGSLVVYANKITKTATDKVTGEDVETQIPFLKGYTVFNAEQIDGLPEQFNYTPPAITSIPDKLRRIESVDAFIKNTGAEIRHGGNRAFYTPTQDFVQLPPFECFKEPAS